MKKIIIEIKWGLLFTVAALLWMVFEKAMGWHGPRIADHAIYTNLFAFVAIIVYVFALMDKRKNYYGGYMSWKQGFLSGMVLSVVIALLTPLSQYITLEWISPEYFENVINYSVETGELSREEAESKFNLPVYIYSSFGFALIVGAVTSAVVAIFVSRKAQNSIT
jgi:hypothetical protein